VISHLWSTSFQTREALRQVCSALGITVSFASLPPELRGYNCSFEDKREIVISTDQSFPGAHEHTLLHELREILEDTFEKLGHPTVNRQDLEEHAEGFAASVRAEAIYRMVPTLCDYADNVDRKWKRIVAYLFFGAFVCVSLLGCALLPRWKTYTLTIWNGHVTYIRNVVAGCGADFKPFFVFFACSEKRKTWAANATNGSEGDPFDDCRRKCGLVG